MRYPNCEKAIAFKLFEKGKRPSEIFGSVRLKKCTIFNYYQEWKKEQQINKPEGKHDDRHRFNANDYKIENHPTGESKYGELERKEKISIEKKYKDQRKAILKLES